MMSNNLKIVGIVAGIAIGVAVAAMGLGVSPVAVLSHASSAVPLPIPGIPPH